MVTGMAGLCPIGADWPQVRDALRGSRSGVTTLPDWDQYAGLKTRLGGLVSGFAVPPH